MNKFLYEKENHHISMDIIQLRFINQENSTSFTVIRDPIDRLISKYKMDFNLVKNNILKFSYESRN